MTIQGLSERQALRVVQRSASSFRYQPAPDRNRALRGQIVTLAQRHRRYGAGMIYLKLRQQGLLVNHKRVDRLYSQENLKLKRREAQEGADHGSPALGEAQGAERGLVHGLCRRPQR